MKKKYNLKSGNPERKRVIIFIIILLIVFTAFFLYFKTDIFRTKRGAFIRYFKTTDNSIQLFLDKDMVQYDKYKRKNCYIRRGSLKIIDSTNIADSGIMDKLTANINVKANNEEGQKNIEISAFSETNSLGTLTLFQENDLYGFFYPDVADEYICIKNDNFGEIIGNLDYSEDGTLISSALVDANLEEIDFFGNIYKSFSADTILETNNLQKNKINNYYKILKNNVPNDAYYGQNDVNINIDGNDYKVNQYIMSVSGSQSAYLQSSLLSELSQDSVMMDYVSSKLALLNFAEDYTDVNKLNEKIKEKIGDLNTSPANAKNLKIIVSNYKQQNIQTEIEFGELKIKINHIKNDDLGEISIFTVNNTFVKVGKKDNKYTYELSTIDQDDYAKSISFEIARNGTVEENNITNKISIHFVDGLKKMNIEYEDMVQFVSEEELGLVNDIENHSTKIINDYSKTEQQELIANLKNKINQVYTLKGSQIGINLDPIFK